MIKTDRIVGMQEDVSGALKYVNPNKAPFYLNLLALGKVEEAKSTTVSWVDYTCEGTQTVLSEEMADESGTTVKVADVTVFKPNCFARIEEEEMEEEDQYDEEIDFDEFEDYYDK